MPKISKLILSNLRLPATPNENTLGVLLSSNFKLEKRLIKNDYLATDPHEPT